MFSLAICFKENDLSFKILMYTYILCVNRKSDALIVVFYNFILNVWESITLISMRILLFPCFIFITRFIVEFQLQEVELFSCLTIAELIVMIYDLFTEGVEESLAHHRHRLFVGQTICSRLLEVFFFLNALNFEL
jgi:hypothetical protein